MNKEDGKQKKEEQGLKDKLFKAVGDIGKGAADFAGNVGKGAVDVAGNLGKGAADFAGNVGKGTIDAAGNLGKAAIDVAGNLGKGAADMAGAAGKAGQDLFHKVGEVADQSKQAVFSAMDVNGDGEVNIEDVILMGLSIDGIRIDRDTFLRKEFSRKYSEDIVEQAILQSPMKANISLDEINKVADAVISFERNCVSGISAALGVPGGLAMAATLPMDIAQYYGYMLRAAQKLMYLYGFPEIDVKDPTSIDTETMNMLILSLGVMYGVAGAANAVKAIAAALAVGVEKQLMKKALTKGTIYPIVKSVSKWFGVKMTKQVFAGFFKKSIPVLGGIIGGGITYLSFKPCCDNLKNMLKDTMLSNPKYKDEENYKERLKTMNFDDIEIIDVNEDEYTEI